MLILSGRLVFQHVEFSNKDNDDDDDPQELVSCLLTLLKLPSKEEMCWPVQNSFRCYFSFDIWEYGHSFFFSISPVARLQSYPYMKYQLDLVGYIYFKEWETEMRVCWDG